MTQSSRTRPWKVQNICLEIICIPLNISGYSNATATLTFAGKSEIDPLKENCPDPKFYLVQTLDKLNKQNPGQITPIIAKMHQEAQQHLKNYLDTAKVTL